MSTETAPEVDEQLERQLSFSHYGGRASAFEEVQRTLLMEAGNLFASGNDKLAKYLRDTLSPIFAERGKDARKTQEENQP